MIYEIDKTSLDQEKVKNSLIDVEYYKKEFENNPFAKLLVLEEENKIIGYLYYSDIYDRAEINQIEIELLSRNYGKGKMLMKFFTKTVDKNITLEVKKDNIPAIKLYKDFQFEEKAIRKGYYNGTDGILMERNKDSH